MKDKKIFKTTAGKLIEFRKKYSEYGKAVGFISLNRDKQGMPCLKK